MNAPTPRFRDYLPLLSCLLLVCGCASDVKRTFEGAPAGQNGPLLPYSGTTHIFGSLIPDEDGTQLGDEGYVRIGTSSFKTSGHVTYDEIQAEAREVGADVVLFSMRNPETGRTQQPFAQAQDGTPRELAPYVHVSGALTSFGGNAGTTGSVGGGMMDFNGRVTSSGIPGVSSETMAAINATRFEYSATFWRRVRNSPRQASRPP
jgi:hypothetical protein